MKSSSQYASLLRDRNLKATSIRLEILNLISNYNKAIAFSEIQKKLASFDRVTLYRTMQALLENGIIHKAIVEENETFYAICSSNCTSHYHEHNHIHFMCTNCKEVTCVHSTEGIKISIENHSISSLEIGAKGTCPSCL